MDTSQKLRNLQKLRADAAQLEAEIAAEISDKPAWPPKSYYTTYHLLAGMVLGFIGAATSLLFNIVGATMLGKHPLELIRVYLTFPLGERALELESGFVLAAGCCLYLGTGMFGGIPFHLILSRFFDKASTYSASVPAFGLKGCAARAASLRALRPASFSSRTFCSRAAVALRSGVQ